TTKTLSRRKRTRAARRGVEAERHGRLSPATPFATRRHPLASKTAKLPPPPPARVARRRRHRPPEAALMSSRRPATTLAPATSRPAPPRHRATATAAAATATTRPTMPQRGGPASPRAIGPSNPRRALIGPRGGGVGGVRRAGAPADPGAMEGGPFDDALFSELAGCGAAGGALLAPGAKAAAERGAAGGGAGVHSI
ncbi:Protein of unknown function, partial [Gryllus bimaculatus]